MVKLHILFYSFSPDDYICLLITNKRYFKLT